MASKASHALLLLLFFMATASAFNITNILSQYPDFSNFSTILSQTHLADEINSRTTITVLAVDGGALGAISGLPVDVQKRILSVHVILDYYDTIKFKDIKKSTVLTTLFQTTGTADQRQGFLNMSRVNGQVAFGSAMPGSPLNANFVKTVLTRPYNISVLQVSSVIVPPGITSLNITTPPPPPPPVPVSAPASAPAKGKKPASPPVEAPTADAPEADIAPEADAPVAADAPAPSAKNAADAPEADEKSGAGRVVVGAGFGVAMMGAILLGL